MSKKKWEYKSIKLRAIFFPDKSEIDKLNKAGNQGWELVKTHYNSYDKTIYAIMKKEK